LVVAATERSPITVSSSLIAKPRERHLSLVGSRAAPKSQVHEVYRLAAQRKLRAVIHECYPLDHAQTAHEHVSSRDVFGRVMLSL
jgi:D-arabinose 1-dehydrogenase-like Zn-dependent alcohol dehydrogenase